MQVYKQSLLVTHVSGLTGSFNLLLGATSPEAMLRKAR